MLDRTVMALRKFGFAVGSSTFYLFKGIGAGTAIQSISLGGWGGGFHSRSEDLDLLRYSYSRCAFERIERSHDTSFLKV